MDPARRLDAKGALAHPWISGDQASSVDIHATVKDQLLRFNARRKLRAAIKTVTMVNRLKRLGMAAANTASQPTEGNEQGNDGESEEDEEEDY